MSQRFLPIFHPQTDTHMQSTDGNQLWCPGQSLWSLIAEHVPGSELPKIRTALGCSLVDMFTEVHAEVRGFYDCYVFLLLFLQAKCCYLAFELKHSPSNSLGEACFIIHIFHAF